MGIIDKISYFNDVRKINCCGKGIVWTIQHESKKVNTSVNSTNDYTYCEVVHRETGNSITAKRIQQDMVQIRFNSNIHNNTQERDIYYQNKQEFKTDIKQFKRNTKEFLETGELNILTC